MANPNITLPGATGASRHDQVQAELIAILFSRARVAILVNLTVAILSVVYLWSKVPGAALAIWFVLACLLTLARLIVVVYYQRQQSSKQSSIEHAPRWGSAYAIGAGAMAILWAVGAVAVGLFVPFEPELALFVSMVLGGLAAGSALALASYLPASYAFMGPLMAAIMVIFLIRADLLGLTLAGMGVAFLVINVRYAHNTRRTLAESIALRFENIHLIEELQEKKAEAEEANVAKSRFLAAASHDLRQPLHALTLFVAALDERNHSAEIRAIVDNVNVSVQALEKMFNALLDVSRLDAGVLRPVYADFRLQPLFDRLLNEYAPEVKMKGLEFHCDASTAVVCSDVQLLERILRNYLTNAIRYTEHGYVALRAVVESGAVRVEVADSGIGIPPDQHREIFREFHQLQNPERDRTKGLGLGLAIVERLARLLDHPIAVQSLPDSGSVFSVMVPIGDPAAVEDARDEVVERVLTDLAGLRVLVIDDESGVREGMRALLVQWGLRGVTRG